eukprot:SAG11_NODE_6393_length_1322_cov_1.623876_1_plen_79_part_00
MLRLPRAGSTVDSFHTLGSSGRVVRASFIVTAQTQAWCDGGGTVVSFTNLGLSQSRNTGRGKLGRRCGHDAEEVFTGY